MVIVTHEIGFAYELADRVVFMNQGVVTASGAPRELLLSNANPRLATFVGRVTEQACRLGRVAAPRSHLQLHLPTKDSRT